MVRIGISVEGTTEERFLRLVLEPYLATQGIYVTPISMNGAVNLDKVRSELKKIAHGFDYVATFYDFYGFQHKQAQETRQSLEEKIRGCVHDSIQPKLIPHIQMHEFEALLFSCPQTLGQHVQARDKGLNSQDWAQAVLDEFHGQPEAVNDSPLTAPSKRLEQYTNYRKTTHGPDIAKGIGVKKLREMCPGFDQWLARIESTGITQADHP